MAELAAAPVVSAVIVSVQPIGNELECIFLFGRPVTRADHVCKTENTVIHPKRLAIGNQQVLRRLLGDRVEPARSADGVLPSRQISLAVNKPRTDEVEGRLLFSAGLQHLNQHFEVGVYVQMRIVEDIVIMRSTD